MTSTTYYRLLCREQLILTRKRVAPHGLRPFPLLTMVSLCLNQFSMMLWHCVMAGHHQTSLPNAGRYAGGVRGVQTNPPIVTVLASMDSYGWHDLILVYTIENLGSSFTYSCISSISHLYTCSSPCATTSLEHSRTCAHFV